VKAKIFARISSTCTVHKEMSGKYKYIWSEFRRTPTFYVLSIVAYTSLVTFLALFSIAFLLFLVFSFICLVDARGFHLECDSSRSILSTIWSIPLVLMILWFSRIVLRDVSNLYEKARLYEEKLHKE
jgi:uncharacterized BrkB/YihY/UPF0761 family membrane protein